LEDEPKACITLYLTEYKGITFIGE
jgi:hypothetical protein